MSTVHYEHGKYHVHYEYADAAKKENTGKNNGLRQADDSKEYLIAHKTFSFSTPVVIRNNFGSFISDLITSPTINDYLPPRA
jgi:hypothetical protein